MRATPSGGAAWHDPFLTGLVAKGHGGRDFVFGEGGAVDLTVPGCRLRSQYNNGEGPGGEAVRAGGGNGEVTPDQNQISAGDEVALDE